MKQRFHFGLLGVLGLLLLGCAGAAEVNEVVVEVSEQGYLPAKVTVLIGKDARLTLRNTGTEEHDLGILEIPVVSRGKGDPMAGMAGMNTEMATPLQLHIVAAPGAANSVDVTPTKVGEYEFRCQIAGHSEIGTLIVARSVEESR